MTKSPYSQGVANRGPGRPKKDRKVYAVRVSSKVHAALKRIGSKTVEKALIALTQEIDTARK